MPITLAALRARRQHLEREREANIEKLREHEKQEHGFAYVMGELDMMIAQEEQEERETAERAAADAQLAALLAADAETKAHAAAGGAV